MKKIILSVSTILGLFAAKLAWALENPNSGLFVDLPTGNTALGIVQFAIQNILLPLVGIISILFIIIGGFRYVSSAGNDEMAAAGKKTMVNAIIGLVIVIVSYTIVVVVFNSLGVT